MGGCSRDSAKDEDNQQNILIKWKFYVVSRFSSCERERLTEILKVNSNLMHATCERFTEHNTCLAIVTQFLECCRALFALW